MDGSPDASVEEAFPGFVQLTDFPACPCWHADPRRRPGKEGRTANVIRILAYGIHICDPRHTVPEWRALPGQAGGHGDIALSLNGWDRIGYFHLWPHARAWELRRPQPSLRCVPDAPAVGQLIQNAWSRVHPQAQTVAIESPPVTQPAVRTPHDHAVTA